MNMRRLILMSAMTAGLLSCGAAPALATETITYGYDARGRLVQVKRTGPVNTTTNYTLDKAENRTAKATTAP